MRDPKQLIREVTEVAAPPMTPELRLHLITPRVPLWYATAQDLEPLGLAEPYWAFAWPGGQALARFILDHPEHVRGRTVLDFGAGSGLCAIAAMLCGARRALATDIDPVSVAAIELNAALNGVEVEASPEDVTLPGSTRVDEVDLILAADVLYDDTLSAPVLGLLRRKAANTLVWAADPGRGRVPKDWSILAEYQAPDDVDPGTGTFTRRTLILTP